MMGFYERWIVPRLLDLAMRNRLLDHYRHQTIALARGLVLEFGIGSGLNLPLYGPAVTRVVGSIHRIAAAGEQTSGGCDRPCVAASRIGGACSLRRCGPRYDRDDLDLVLDPESHRGAHRDAEGSQTGWAVAFRRARPVTGNQDCSLAASVDAMWKRISGGCHLDRKMDDLIRAAGFRIDAIESGYMKGPKPWTFMFQGRNNDRAAFSG